MCGLLKLLKKNPQPFQLWTEFGVTMATGKWEVTYRKTAGQAEEAQILYTNFTQISVQPLSCIGQIPSSPD
jgi:hypothetical protein